MFNPGQRYIRRDIHKLYGGQEQGGISIITPVKVSAEICSSYAETPPFVIICPLDAPFTCSSRLDGEMWNTLANSFIRGFITGADPIQRVSSAR